MLSPDFLDHLSDDLVELYNKYQDDVIKDVARRIAKTGVITDSAKWQIEKLQQSGLVYNDVINQLSKITNKTENELEELFINSSVEALRYDDAIYKRAGLNPLPIAQSPAMLQIIQSGVQKTGGTLKNLTLTTANMTQTAFVNALDRAYMQVSTGSLDYNAAIRQAIRDTAQSSLSIVYPSGHIDNVEVAVRRATLTGVSQTANTLQLTRAADMGCDLVEVTAHGGARPSHAEWQGKIYSLSSRNAKYPDFMLSTGYGTGNGLGGWNCRHSFFPFFEGISSKNYTAKDLKELNAKSIDYQGEKMTVYDATQKQRAIERDIRKTRRELATYDDLLKDGSIDDTLKAGLKDDFNNASVKLKSQEKKLKDFLDETGLQPDAARLHTYGFNRSVSQKAVHAAKRGTPHTMPKLPVNKNSEIYQKLGDTHYNALHNILNEAPEKQRAVWAKYENELKINNLKYNGGAYYDSQGINVNIEENAKGYTYRAPYQTTLHEFAHNIDHIVNQKSGHKLGTFSYNYKDHIFDETLRKEIKDRIDNLTPKIKAEFYKNINNADWLYSKGYIKNYSDEYKHLKKFGKWADKPLKFKKDFVYKHVENEIKLMTNAINANLSDIIEGATNAKIKCGFGHGAKYWKDRAHGLSAEAFAEMFDSSVANMKQYEAIQKYFPKSCKIFKEMLDIIIKR